MSKIQENAGGAGLSFATSSSATTITLRFISKYGIGRQVWVGWGNAEPFWKEETSLGLAIA